MRSLAPLKSARPLETLDEVVARDDERAKGWAKLVGDARLQQALDIQKNGEVGTSGYRSATLPELLIEAALRARGADYDVQVDLGWARPDFVVRVPGGAVVVEALGDYWHGTDAAKAKDAARAAQLIGTNVTGGMVLRVVTIWESEIYQSEAVIERVWNG